MTDEQKREKAACKVTILGSIVNFLLLVCKFIAGILGHSSAMIADAVHSLSDFATDLVVLVFVRLSSKPEDADHHYGHGKYETLATCAIGISLIVVGVMIGINAVKGIITAINGEELPRPGMLAFWAAVVCIIAKEWLYRITIKVAKKIDSPSVEANAWHHRSDALSSIGTALGIGGAAILGHKWAVLDPIAALVVSIFIAITAIRLFTDALDQLLEKSLPKSIEQQICKIVYEEEGVSDIHHLRTRKIGSKLSIDMHIRMSGELPLKTVHQKSIHIEKHLKNEFGQGTFITLHIEPLKSEY